MSDYKFDRSVFKIQTFHEADRANIFSRDTPYPERLRQAYYLISQAYGFSLLDQPRMDKSYFSSKKLSD
jgi:hypothetical protein